MQAEIFHDRQVLVETEFLRHVTRAASQLGGILERVQAHDGHASFGRAEQAGDQAQQCCLSRTVRPDNSRNPPGGNGTCHAVERSTGAFRKNLAQCVELNDRCVHLNPPPIAP